MSTDPNFANFAPPPAPKKSKIWVWLGLGCGVTLLLCCGGGVGLVYYVKNKVLNLSTDPVEVARIGSSIAEIDMPADFRPVMSMKIDIAGAGMTMAAYSGPDEQGGLFLMEVIGQNAGADPQVLRAQMEAQMRQQQGGKGSRQINVRETRKLALEIRGKPATFDIQKGTDAQTNAEYVQAIGTFEGKQGTDLLFMQLPAENYDDDRIDQMLRSIK